MASSCSSSVPPPCLPPAVTDPRLLDNFTRRFNTATSQALTPSEPHPVNGDLALGDKCGSYSKGIKQAGHGLVDLTAFAKFQTAISSGSFSSFEMVPKGGTAKQNGPMGAYARIFCGADSSAFGTPSVLAPPAVGSKWYATELVELYWCSLLRDVAFTDYLNSSVARDAADELSGAPQYQGPKDGSGRVTAELLFRGNFAGETVGPYLSQLLLTPTNFGAAPFDQRYITYRAGIDYMTDPKSWYMVQQGIASGFTNQPESSPRYLHDGRGLAAWTHVDELYQAYFTAYLVLQSLGVAANPTGPYATAQAQKPFGTFGGPDIAAVLAEVAKCALNAVWYQKWVCTFAIGRNRARAWCISSMTATVSTPPRIRLSSIPTRCRPAFQNTRATFSPSHFPRARQPTRRIPPGMALWRERASLRSSSSAMPITTCSGIR